jgi:hypothetical protein
VGQVVRDAPTRLSKRAKFEEKWGVLTNFSDFFELLQNFFDE